MHEHRGDRHRGVSQDCRRDGVGAQVLVAVGLQLVPKVDDLGSDPGDLERRIDRPVTRLGNILP